MKTAQTKTPESLEEPTTSEKVSTTPEQIEKKPEIKIEDIYVPGQKTTSEEEKTVTGEKESVVVEPETPETPAAAPETPETTESVQEPEVKESLENTVVVKEAPVVEEYPEQKVQEANLEKEAEAKAEIKTGDLRPESESEPEVPAQALDKEEEVSVEKAKSEEPEKEKSLGEEKESSDSVPDISLDAPLKSESAEKNEEDAPPVEKKNKKIFIIGIIVSGILVLLTVAIGFYYLSSQNKEQEAIPEVVEEVVEEKIEVVAAELNKEDWKIEILNGSGVAGAAAKLQRELEDLGYEVVNADNAPEDEQITRLFVSEELVEQSELFVDDIEDIIEISGIVKEFEDSTATARIIIGEK